MSISSDRWTVENELEFMHNLAFRSLHTLAQRVAMLKVLIAKIEYRERYYPGWSESDYADAVARAEEILKKLEK